MSTASSSASSFEIRPKVDEYNEKDGILSFKLSNVDVCFANAIRRTIISEIPTVVLKKDKCNILVNTTRMNNQIIEMRLGCIPVHIKDLTLPLGNYLLEIDEENKTESSYIVTTKDFKVKNLTTNTYLDSADLRTIFPPFVPPTGKSGEYFIEFVRLRPRISEEIPGEKIK